jgi:hypothetical protein
MQLGDTEKAALRLAQNDSVCVKGPVEFGKAGYTADFSREAVASRGLP